MAFGRSPFQSPRARVDSLVDHNHILISSETTPLLVGDRLPVYSQSSKDVIAYAEVIKILSVTGKKTQAKAKVISTFSNSIILEGDTLLKMDFTEAPDDGFEGRTGLMIVGDRELSSRYKPLVFQGLFIHQTAETLDQGEWLLGVPIFGRGFTDRLMIYTNLFGNFSLAPNVGAKFRLFRNTHVTTTFGFEYTNRITTQHTLYSFVGYLDIPSGSKIINHNAVRITLQVNESDSNDSVDRAIQRESEIRSGYGYLFDNWDRILFGPTFSFNPNRIGAYISYMWVWDSFHIAVSLQTKDLTQIKFGPIGGDYIFPFIDLFWRF